MPGQGLGHLSVQLFALLMLPEAEMVHHTQLQQAAWALGEETPV